MRSYGEFIKKRKEKLLDLVKKNTTARLHRCGYSYEEINKITSMLNPDALTIGFARRFATYKRATLIFKDLERITQLFSNSDRPITNYICRKSIIQR